MAEAPARVSDDEEALFPDVSGLVTEDDTPVDNLFSERQQRLLAAALYDSWEGPPPREDGEKRSFVALANVGLFWSPREPAIVPDALLSVDVLPPADVWPKAHRSYFVWMYGKPPDVVIEVVSNREGGELDRKLRSYERIAVAHYVVFDPGAELGDQRLHAFELRGGAYVEVEGARFPRLGLALTEWEGVYQDIHERWLRWHRLDGSLVETGAERAAAEHERAEAEHERAERLARRLRELGVDPDEA